MPPVIALVGKPDSGKTTMLEALIPILRGHGFQVGTIKHHVHAFEMDTPGKDTWRHKQAGAAIIALSSPTAVGVIRDVKGDSTVADLVDRYFNEVDLVIAEGYKHSNLPKIEVHRTAVAESPLAHRDATWIAMVSDAESEDDIPRFTPDDPEGLARFLIDRFLCPTSPPQASLMVDGRKIALNGFVETFIRQTVIGMTSSLKGCQNPRRITLRINNE